MYQRLNCPSLGVASRPTRKSLQSTPTHFYRRFGFRTNRSARSFASVKMEAESVPKPAPKPAPMLKLLYGTAWKKDATEDLVLSALKAGFRGIDTAAQPRHYNESLVGAAVRSAISSGIVRREDLFIQTKFTSISGQDRNNMPYDPEASLDDQVHASIASSLKNFTFGNPDEAYIDSLVLHSPLDKLVDTKKVWKTLETYVPHRIRQLGISNTDLYTLDQLCQSPDIKIRPACVQNRFSPATQWEVMLRAYCRPRGITFQPFWTLTGNSKLLQSLPVLKLAESIPIDTARALYALVLGLGNMTILDGTRSATHMEEDLKVTELVDAFVQSSEGQSIWSECLAGFKTVIGEQP
ncbi:NADP-dependent oxidoreductase domain-containing protein [Biscogniauxia marginata]|nr:NADP-dependent oxidoreductase domain-containing protein [Biscogniauxia marginata]